jgi:hypothetical protein
MASNQANRDAGVAAAYGDPNKADPAHTCGLVVDGARCGKPATEYLGGWPSAPWKLWLCDEHKSIDLKGHSAVGNT